MLKPHCCSVTSEEGLGRPKCTLVSICTSLKAWLVVMGGDMDKCYIQV